MSGTTIFSSGGMGVLMMWQIQVTILLVVAILVTKCFHRKFASLRHCLLLCFLVATTTIPILNRTVPRMDALVQPVVFFSSEKDGSGGEQSADKVPGLQISTPSIHPANDEIALVGTRQRLESDTVGLERLQQMQQVENRGEVPVEQTVSNSSLAEWAIAVWILGMLVVLLRAVYSSFALSAVWRNAQAPALSTVTMLDDVCKQLGVVRTPAVRVRSGDSRPMTWGVLAPKIVIPKNCTGTELRAVLLHEVSHIIRRDYVVEWSLQLICALQWFQPLVWIISRMIRSERERACDNIVLRSGVVASEYALCVLSYAKQGSSHAGALAMSNASLTARLKSILAECERPNLRPGHVALAVTLVVCSCIPLAAFFQPSDSFIAQEVPLAVSTEGSGAIVRFGSPKMRPAAVPAEAVYSPNGELVAVRCNELPGAVIWDVASEEPVIEISERVSKVAFSPSGKFLATGHDDGTVALWSSTTGELKQRMHIEHLHTTERKGANCRVQRLAFAREDRVVTLHPQVLRQWDLSLGKEDLDARRIGFALFGSDQQGLSLNGQMFARRGRGLGQLGLLLHDLSKRSRPQFAETVSFGSAANISFSSEGKIVVCSTTDHNFHGRYLIRAFKTPTLDAISLPPLLSEARLALVDPYRARVVVERRNEGTRQLEIWGLEEAEVIQSYSVPSTFRPLAVSPSREQLIVAIGSQLVFWDLSTGDYPRLDVARDYSPISAVAYSQDGSKVATAADCSFVNLWDAETGQHLRRVPFCPASGGAAHSLAFMPNGDLAVVGFYSVPVLDTDRVRGIPGFADGTHRMQGKVQLVATNGEVVADEDIEARDVGSVRLVAMDGRLLLAIIGNRYGRNRDRSAVEIRDREIKIANRLYSTVGLVCAAVNEEVWSGIDHDGVIKHWDTVSGERAGELLLPIENCEASTTDIAGGVVAYTTNGLSVSIFDIAQQEDVLSFNSGAEGVSIGMLRLSQNGGKIAVLKGEHQLFVHDVVTGKVVAERELNSRATCMTFSSDGDQLLIGCVNGTALQWRYGK
ncbi:MAG: hypothetical protein Aurels2KO_37490 [Aureliella sp.]